MLRRSGMRIPGQNVISYALVGAVVPILRPPRFLLTGIYRMLTSRHSPTTYGADEPRVSAFCRLLLFFG
jgi:hypothetical protein